AGDESGFAAEIGHDVLLLLETADRTASRGVLFIEEHRDVTDEFRILEQRVLLPPHERMQPVPLDQLSALASTEAAY
ncbi:MAG: hypothetical protein WB495_28710, partial [Xanthobacteraceae bacterium]